MKENIIKFLGSLYGQHSRWGVFDKNHICPAITASAGLGGGHCPMVIVNEQNNTIRIHSKN